MASTYVEDEKKSDVEANPRQASQASIPFEKGVSLSREDQKTLSRRNSVSLTRGPTKVNPSAKIPGDFRTLRSVVYVFCSTHLVAKYSSVLCSVYVTDTKEGRASKGKKDVAGASILDSRPLQKLTVTQTWQPSSGTPSRRLKFAPVSQSLRRKVLILHLLQRSFRRTEKTSSVLLRKIGSKRFSGTSLVVSTPLSVSSFMLKQDSSGFGGLLFVASVICFISW